MGWTSNPVTGAAIHRIGMFSTLAPRVSKMRLTLAFCSAKPIWMPRKPKLMFQISQNDKRGLERTARGAAAWAVMAIPEVKGSARRSNADGLAAARRQPELEPCRRSDRAAGDADRE